MGGYWDENGYWHNEDTSFPSYPQQYPVFHIFEERGTSIPRYDVVIFQLLEEIKKMLETLLERTK